MKYFVSLLFLLLIGCASLKTNSSIDKRLSHIPLEEQKKLEALIRKMMTGDYFAATLFGNKPMTFQEFHEDPWKMSSFFMACPSHHYFMEEGWNTWQKYQSLFPSRRFIFAKIPSSVGYQFIILINKKAFEKTFHENRDIFQQALGPEITLNQIFKDFEEGKKTFSDALNHHEGLVGIVLGYGREASLRVYRDNKLKNTIMSKSLHPLAPVFDHNSLISKATKTSLKLKEIRFAREGVKWHRIDALKMDYNDAYAELNRWKSDTEFFFPTWQELFSYILPPNFRCIKNSEETERHRKDYDYAMVLARKAFESKTFLKAFLEEYCRE